MENFKEITKDMPEFNDKPLKNPVYDEETKHFIEQDEFIEKQNQKNNLSFCHWNNSIAENDWHSKCRCSL